MKRIVAILCICGMLFSFAGCRGDTALQRFQYTYLDTFDTVTTLLIYADTQKTADEQAAAIHARLRELHQLYTIYDGYPDMTNLKAVNDRKGETVKVDAALFSLLQLGKQAYTLTDGKVNMALGSVLRLWHDARTVALDDPDAAKLPDTVALQAAAKHTSIDNVVLDVDAQTVSLKDTQTYLDVGAFAKGYAVQQAAEYARERGVTSALISVGGNVAAIGDKNGSPFVIGIEDPAQPQSHLLTVDIRDRAVVTSGNYQRYFTVDGVRYHHLIDPTTLYPADYWASVTIIGPDSGVADILSTALFLSTKEEGQALLNGLEGYEAIWVDTEGEIQYSDHFSY